MSISSKYIHLIATALISMSTSACGDPPASDYPAQQSYTEDTTLGSGDLFEVRVFRQKELSGVYRVSSEGTITFPMIGSLTVAKRSPEQVEADIRERLADGYLVDPQVSVLVKEYNSKKVLVMGQVRRPGSLNYSEGMTIVDAIARAGGFSALASKNAVIVTRGKTAYTVPVASIGKGTANNFYIRPGDMVDVPKRLF